MKTSKKREFQQIKFIHSLDIGFMKVYKKCTAKSFSYLLIDTTLASDNPLRFRKNILERI